MSRQLRTIVLVVDAIALLGVIGFSVAAAVDRDNTAYLIGQVVCAGLVLGSVVMLHRLPDNFHPRDTTPVEGDHDDR